jgi:hypothetical protein
MARLKPYPSLGFSQVGQAHASVRCVPMASVRPGRLLGLVPDDVEAKVSCCRAEAHLLLFIVHER